MQSDSVQSLFGDGRVRGGWRTHSSRGAVLVGGRAVLAQRVSTYDGPGEFARASSAPSRRRPGTCSLPTGASRRSAMAGCTSSSATPPGYSPRRRWPGSGPSGFRSGRASWPRPCGSSASRTRASRPTTRALLAARRGRRREEWDPFFALDERFYSWLHAEPDRWERAADRFAEAPDAEPSAAADRGGM